MKIFTETNLAPNLQRYLSCIDEKYLYHRTHGLKHPGALFNTSIGKVESSLSDFLGTYQEFNSGDFDKVNDKHTGDLLKKYRIFLYALREYMDDCFHVVKCFVELPQKEVKDRNQFLWIRKNGDQDANTVLDGISEYKLYLDDIVNELKHNNGVLGAVWFWDENYPREHCLGYFIANVVAEVYQPVEKIHPKWHDRYTGFSYRRDIAYNLYNIFYLSELILEMIRKKTATEFQGINPTVTIPQDNRVKLFERIMAMPRYHFPDEYFKDVPSISVGDDRKIKVEYPSKLSIKPNRLSRVGLTHSGDGHTREFKVLYM